MAGTVKYDGKWYLTDVLRHLSFALLKRINVLDKNGKPQSYYKSCGLGYGVGTSEFSFPIPKIATPAWNFYMWGPIDKENFLHGDLFK